LRFAVDMLVSADPIMSSNPREKGPSELEMRIETVIAHSMKNDRDRFSRILLSNRFNVVRSGFRLRRTRSGVVKVSSHQPGESPLELHLETQNVTHRRGGLLLGQFRDQRAVETLDGLVSVGVRRGLAAWVRLNRAIRRASPLVGMQRVASGRGGPERWYSMDDGKPTSVPSSHRGRVFDSVDPLMIREARQAGPPRRGRRARERRREIPEATRHRGPGASNTDLAVPYRD